MHNEFYPISTDGFKKIEAVKSRFATQCAMKRPTNPHSVELLSEQGWQKCILFIASREKEADQVISTNPLIASNP